MAAAVAALFLFAATGSASATTGHLAPTTFGGPGSEEGQFTGGPAGVGVGTAGTVFASDPGDSRIESSTAAGVFKGQFPVSPAQFTSLGAVAVDSSVSGGVYVAVTNAETGAPEVAKYSAAGTFKYTLSPGLTTSINYGVIAVDPSTGTVYTTGTKSDTFQQVVDSFNGTTGAFIASFTGETGSPDGGSICPTALAVDHAGHVFVLDPCKGRVDRYSNTGTYEATVDNGSRGAPSAIAADPETGDLSVAEAGVNGNQITSFAAAGASAPQTVSAAAVGGLAALAVGPDASIYAADNANSVIDLFAPFEGPDLTTEAAAPVEPTTATLNGTVNPEGVATKYHYEWGTEPTYGSSTPEQDAGSGSSAVPAPAELTGLVPNTLYHYRLIGSNASGSIVGEDARFTSAAAPPVVDGSAAFATPITPTTARVHATVNPEHSSTTFVIEYGTTAAYGSTAPEAPGEVGSANGDTAVATALTGLQPGTLYHYRASAENGTGGPQQGADNTFITAPAAPATGTELTTRKATLTGTIDPHGAPTTYHFNYGPGSAYGASTPEVSAGSGNGEQLVSEHISGLSPGTTYHVQVVATTNGITSSGADGTFTTPLAPTATVSDPVAVTTSSATVLGVADTHGLVGTYHFEVTATEGAFATNTADQPLSATTGLQSVSVPVSALPSGQSLRVRLIVSSNEATEVSQPVVFATATPPPEGFPAPLSPGSLYGCTSPKLNSVNAKIKPGATIAVSGSDLGLAGTVLLGEYTLNPTGWSATGFTIEVPADATGTLGLTVNCGAVSNTVAVATTGAPPNSFTITKQAVNGTTATFIVELPGAGTLRTSGNRIKSTDAKVAGPGTETVRVTLNRVGAKALAQARKRTLAAGVQLRFTPTGGTTTSQTATVTFKRKAGHR